MKIKSFLNLKMSVKFQHKFPFKRYNWGYNHIQDTIEFKKESINTINYICDLNLNLSKKSLNNVKDNICDKISDNITKEPINFKESMKIIDDAMNNYTLYNHPGFMKDNHLTSYPAILGNLISDAYNNPGVSWISNPVGFELEHKILKYLAEKLNLPKQFQSNTTGNCVHFDSGESANVAVLSARSKKKTESNFNDLSKFCYYHSSHSNSYINKAIKIAGGINREIEVILKNGNYEMNCEKLENQIIKDINEGYVPCFINSNFGTTKTCGSDDMIRIGEISKKYNLWNHVDASMLGNSLILNKDASKLLSNYSHSIVIDSSRTLPFGLDSAMFWVYDPKYIFKSLNEEFVLYVQIFEKNQAEMINYSYGTARLTKSFRIYLVLKCFGLSGLRRVLENNIKMGKLLIEKLEKGKFQSLFSYEIGIICLRIKDKCNNSVKKFVDLVNNDGKLSLLEDSLIIDSKETNFVKICLNDLYINEKRVEEISEMLHNYSLSI